MELPEAEVCYRVLECRDARFDGLMYVAIQSTGIYCRPICPARTPKFQNCHFYPSAAAAQDAGYRPCLRCRPETAPDLSSWRGSSNTVSRALSLIAEGALDGPGASVERLANRLGLGERQLRRLFLQHLGASPISVAQTRRVLFAKQLLHDTCLPIADVALAGGFSSLRRFNEVFHNLFHRPPGALRRKTKTNSNAVADTHEGVTLRLRYRPPYDWDSIHRALESRAIPQVELVADGKYRRTVKIDGHTGSIEVSHEPRRESIQVKIRFPNVRSFPAIVTRVRRQFDLGADIETIEAHLAQDPMLAPLIAMRPGLRAPGVWDSLETDAFPADVFPENNAALLRGAAAAMQAANGQTGDNSIAGAQAVSAAVLLLRRAETWRPWRAYAAQHLWAAGLAANSAMDAAASQLKSQQPRALSRPSIQLERNQPCLKPQLKRFLKPLVSTPSLSIPQSGN